MPEIRIVFYKEEDGEVPVLEWLRHLLENPTEKLIRLYGIIEGA